MLYTGVEKIDGMRERRCNTRGHGISHSFVAVLPNPNTREARLGIIPRCNLLSSYLRTYEILSTESNFINIWPRYGSDLLQDEEKYRSVTYTQIKK